MGDQCAGTEDVCFHIWIIVPMQIFKVLLNLEAEHEALEDHEPDWRALII